MESMFHHKKILKPDVPPPRATDYFDRFGYGLILTAIGLCFVAGAVAILALLA